MGIANVLGLLALLPGPHDAHVVAQTRASGIALVGGTLIDGTGAPPLRDSVVLVRGDRIERVGTVATLPVPAGYESISTEGMSVLPGLWDLHVHLIYNGHPTPGAWFKHDAEFESTTVPGSARQMLMAGVTSVRDLAARSRTSQKTSDHLLRMARATGCHRSRQRIGLPRLGPDRHRIEDCLHEHRGRPRPGC